VPKVNVYLPAPLHEAARHHELSLSPICQKAIQAAVNERSRLEGATADISDVAARLRADKVAAEEIQYEQGYELGADWARNHATWSELRSLAWHDRGDDPLVLLDEDHSLRNFLISWAISQNDEFDPYGAFAKLEGSDAFDHGVLTAAFDVFRAVKDLVE
jgi:hypothetical protein